MKLKICGMKYQENISEVAQLQPDYLGFIFYENSSRFFDGIIPQLPESIKKVGVFVNSDISNIIEKITKYNLDIIQLHGNEDEEYVLSLKMALQITFPDVILWKVFSVGHDFNFEQLIPFENKVDKFLFDTQGELPGGNGYTFNWDILKSYPSTKPYILSGGIGIEESEHIANFLATDVSKFCHAIDVNSKFEIEAGLKNVEKLKEFKKTLNYPNRNDIQY